MPSDVLIVRNLDVSQGNLADGLVFKLSTLFNPATLLPCRDAHKRIYQDVQYNIVCFHEKLETISYSKHDTNMMDEFPVAAVMKNHTLKP